MQDEVFYLRKDNKALHLEKEHVESQNQKLQDTIYVLRKDLKD